MKSNFLVIFAISIFFSGCKPFEGKLQTSAPFNFRKVNSPLGTPYFVNIPPGEYPLTAELKSKNRIDLYVKNLKDENQRNTTLPLFFPKSKPFPTEGGSFEYSGTDIKQAFGIKGYLQVKLSETTPESGTQSCTYYANEWQCGWVCERGNDCDWRCDYVQVKKYGKQTVRYFQRITKRDIFLDIIEDNTQNHLGNVFADQQERKQIYLEVGVCQ